MKSLEMQTIVLDLAEEALGKAYFLCLKNVCVLFKMQGFDMHIYHQSKFKFRIICTFYTENCGRDYTLHGTFDQTIEFFNWLKKRKL